MFWNPSAKQIDTYTIDMIFMFNTNVSCPYSYVQVFDHSTIHKFRCVEKKVETRFDNGTVEFMTFVQKCYAYIQKDTEVEFFKYVIYGSKFIDNNLGSAEPSDEFLVEYPMVD